MKTWLLIITVAALTSGCSYGLPKSQQNDDVQAVVAACYQHHGETFTSYDRSDGFTKMTCFWNAMEQERR